MVMSVDVAKLLVDVLIKKPGIDLFSSKEAEKSLEERKTILVQQLVKSGIDPAAFDALISSEINRNLKVQFGVVFLIFTFLFTALSYAIVVLDGVLKWGISPMAITALVVETPIQFIGLLYIIARNLFPGQESATNRLLALEDGQTSRRRSRPKTKR